MRMIAAEHHTRSDGVARLLRAVANQWAFICVFAAAVGIFAISGVTLDSLGYHYDVEGGSALQKLHPGTLLLVAAVGLRVLARPTLRGIDRLLFQDGFLFVSLCGTLLAIAYIAAALGVPVTPPIDTDLMPILACLVLKDMSRHGLRLIAMALIVFFLCNDLIAFYEAATGTHLIFVVPPDVTGHPEGAGNQTFDWKGHLAWDKRATGMLGHPLDNALITGVFVMILQTRAAAWMPSWFRASLAVISLAAMMAFGGRVAMVLALLLSGALWTFRFLRLIAQSRRLPMRGIAAACAGAPCLIAALALLLSTDFFGRFAERFVADEGSAQARVLMWRLFEPLQWSDIVFGPDQDVVKMWQRLQGLELGIESFWAGMPLGYGIAVTSVILISWVFLFAFIVKATTREAWLPILFFMLVGSTSAGLASKTVAMGNLVVMIFVFLGAQRAARDISAYRPTYDLSRHVQPAWENAS